MAKGISLHVGVDQASPNFPSAPTLKGCKNDARAMRDIAASRDFFKSELLVDKEATYESVEEAIRAAAHDLKGGDIFLFTFAGHGDGMPDNDEDEPDEQDETILLYDFMLLDDLLGRVLWPLFEPDVRVLMVSDSCHSGTLFFKSDGLSSVRKSERLSLGNLEMSLTTEITAAVTDGPRVRTIPDAVLYRHLWEHRDFYERVFGTIPSSAAARPIEASVLLLSACADDEKAGDGWPHGIFTEALLDVWQGGTFSGNYEAFKIAIGSRIPQGRQQHPQLTLVGQPNPAFMAQRPFTI